MLDPAALAQAKALIDYYVQSQPPSWVNYLSIVAIVVSLFAVWASLEQAHTTERSHIRNEWNGIVDICMRHPEFIDLHYIYNYRNLAPSTRLVYDAFSYKLWSLVDYIVGRRLDQATPYSAIILWSVAYHRSWLVDNPYMFPSHEFWEAFENARNEPLTIFRNPALPVIDAKPIRPDADRYSDQVDWDAVSPNYHELIIGPWAPAMMQPNAEGITRNPLISALKEYLKGYGPEDLKTLRILDYGCGPGNIIDHLPTGITELYGLDISAKALKIAEEKAQARGIVFHSIHSDMRDYIDPVKFDVIISSNSVLPTTRPDVIRIFEKIKQNLKPQGRLFAILPSFDTCEALLEYWQDVYRAKAKKRHWLNRNGQQNQYVDRAMSALSSAKKIDRSNLSFADDGVHSQCFHTPSSIKSEFKLAGLELEKEPQRVNYPWLYAKEFDYGYFPDKPEIWDWFAIAKKGAN